MTVPALYHEDGSGFASGCQHDREVLQTYSDGRTYSACKHCGSTSIGGESRKLLLTDPKGDDHDQVPTS